MRNAVHQRGGCGLRVPVPPVSRGVKNHNYELLVHQQSNFVLIQPCRKGRLESVIKHLLLGGELSCLLWSKCTMPARHSRFKRTAAVGE